MDKIRQFHNEEKLGNRKWISRSYYDRPDGQDLFGKLYYTSKLSGGVGTLAGLSYAVVEPIPKDLTGKLLRIGTILVPALGLSATFTCVTYCATNIRQKDDQLNYMIGGAAAGALLGPIMGAPRWGFFGALVCAAFGFAKKTAAMNNTVLLPSIVKKEFSYYFQTHWDTTLLEERKGNWTREPKID